MPKAKKPEIVFDKVKHKFTLDGEKIPSVTEISGIMDKSFFLIPWALNCMEEYCLKNCNDYPLEELLANGKKAHRIIKKDAADIGSAIHEWISEKIKGNNPEIPNDDRIANGITAFLKWQKDNKVEWVESELIICSHKHKFGGILDGVAVVNDELCLIDFKSSNAIYPEYDLQTAGYQIAYEEMTGKKIAKRILLRLGKDDGAVEVHTTDNPEDIDAYLAGLKLKKWQKNIKKYEKVVEK